MAYKLISREYCACTDAYRCEYIADNASDVESLPTDVAAGSNCICTGESSVYLLGADGAWHKF